MRGVTIAMGMVMLGCAGAAGATRVSSAPPDPRTIRDTSDTACAGSESGAQCLVLQVAGMDTLLVPEAAEVEQVAGASEIRVTLAGADPSTGIAWRADGRNLLLAALGRPARIAIVAPRRMLVARRNWLSGDGGEAMAETGNGLADGWMRLGMVTREGTYGVVPQSNDESGTLEVPAGGAPADPGVPQQGNTAGDMPEDVQTGAQLPADPETQGTGAPPIPPPATPPAPY